MARDHSKNIEGYPDLTAFYAIRRADRELERKNRAEINKKGYKNYKKKRKKNKSKKNYKKMEEK